MKTSQILMDALDIIDTPGKWTKHAFARKACGESTANADEAVCFCSLGAIRYASGGESLIGFVSSSIHDRAAEKYLMQSSRELSMRWPADLNDRAESPFDEEMSEMWLSAIFCALADEKEYGTLCMLYDRRVL